MRLNWLSSVKLKAPVKPPLKPRPTGPLPVGLVLESWFWVDREVEEVAGDQSSADLYHWSAMEFGEHWLQRLSLVLARGQGDLVLEAVKTARKNHRGRDGGRGASAEWSQTDCQPCVSLV